jgi:hypothetical protein
MSKPKLKIFSQRKLPTLSMGERAMQRLWSSVSRREWSSLVLVPVSANCSAKAIAAGMLEIGPLFRPHPKVFDGEGAGLPDGPRIAKEMKEHAAGGGTAIATVDPVVSSLAGIPVVLAADVAVLVVPLGEADLGSARSTIEIVGHERILGCVAVE